MKLPSEKAKQKEINQWLFNREIETDTDITQIKDRLTKNKSWYTSFGIWLAIFLTLAMLYLVYVFYMAETGHNVILPEILNWQPLK